MDKDDTPDFGFSLQPGATEKTRRRGKPKRPPPTAAEKLESANPVMRTEGYFLQAYETLWGFPMITSPAKDRALLKRLIDQLGEDLVRSLIDQFMRDVLPVSKGGDPVVSRSRFGNIPDFSYHAQYMLLKRKRGGQLQDRTAGNVHELMKAMGKSK